MNPSTYTNVTGEMFRQANPNRWYEPDAREVNELHRTGYKFLGIELEETPQGLQRTLQCADPEAFIEVFCDTDEQKEFLRGYTLELYITHQLSVIEYERRKCKLQAVPIRKGVDAGDQDGFESDNLELFAFEIEPDCKDGGITDVTRVGYNNQYQGIVRTDRPEYRDIQAIANYFIPSNS